MNLKRTLLSVSLVAAAPLALAQGDSLVGLSVGVFMPQHSEIRDALGSSWFQYGFSPSVRLRGDLDIRPELSFLGQHDDGNRLLIVSLPFAITKRFADDQASTVPYVAAGLGPAYFDYAITRPDLTRVSEKRFGWTAHVEVGMVLSNRLRAHARYIKFSEHDGFKFDGIQVGLSYQFFNL
ncbi:MAG TPA: acyloxyacyl hydrolase [Fimbriimonadaceae bacterium]|nr:acyloxyacyl hydrolase [Fimbriimonadaceae bacterium]